MQPLLGKGHHCFTDMFYTNLLLSDSLLLFHTDITGTVQDCHFPLMRHLVNPGTKMGMEVIHAVDIHIVGQGGPRRGVMRPLFTLS